MILYNSMRKPRRLLDRSTGLIQAPSVVASTGFETPGSGLSGSYSALGAPANTFILTDLSLL